MFEIPMIDFMAAILVAYGLSPLFDGFLAGKERPLSSHLDAELDFVTQPTQWPGDEKTPGNPEAQEAFAAALRHFGHPKAVARQVLTDELETGSHQCYWLIGEEPVASGTYRGNSLLGIVEIHWCPPQIPHNISSIQGNVFEDRQFVECLAQVLVHTGFPSNLQELLLEQHTVPTFAYDSTTGELASLSALRLTHQPRQEVTT